jgi:hypothetical protein
MRTQSIVSCASIQFMPNRSRLFSKVCIAFVANVVKLLSSYVRTPETKWPGGSAVTGGTRLVP